MTGEDLRKIRLAREETQYEFGEWLGVAENTVRNWEAGRRRIPRWVVKRIEEEK